MASQLQDRPKVARDDLGVPEGLSSHSVRKRLLFVLALVIVVVAAVTLLPGLGDLRSRARAAPPAEAAARLAEILKSVVEPPAPAIKKSRRTKKNA